MNYRYMTLSKSFRLMLPSHVFLTSVLVEVNGQLQDPAALPPEKEPPVPIG
jgi:hypothetical protein